MEGYTLALLATDNPRSTQWVEREVETIDQADPESSVPPAEVFCFHGIDLERLDPKETLKRYGLYQPITRQPDRDRVLNLLRQIDSQQANHLRRWFREHRGETFVLLYWMDWETADRFEWEAGRDYGRLAPVTGYF